MTKSMFVYCFWLFVTFYRYNNIITIKHVQKRIFSACFGYFSMLYANTEICLYPIEEARSMGAFSKSYAIAKLCRMLVWSKTVSTVVTLLPRRLRHAVNSEHTISVMSKRQKYFLRYKESWILNDVNFLNAQKWTDTKQNINICYFKITIALLFWLTIYADDIFGNTKTTNIPWALLWYDIYFIS